MSPSPADSPGGRVLVICTGNVCRSPFIERLLQSKLAASGVQVSSAGTGALVGEQIEPRVAQQLLAHGGDPGGFRARQLTAAMVADADLVLTATRRHRGQVVQTYPGAMRYTFTLGDFAHLAGSLRSETLAVVSDNFVTGNGAAELARVARVRRLVADRRGVVPSLEEDMVDIIDPYGQDDTVVAEMVDQVMTLLPTLVRSLGGQLV